MHTLQTSDLSVVGTFVVTGNGVRWFPFSLSPDGETLYLPDPSGNGIYVVNTSNMTESSYWNLADTRSFSVSPDGSRALVTSESPTLGVFNMSSKIVVQTLNLGSNAETHGTPCWDWRGATKRVLLPVNAGVAVLICE